MVVGAFVTSLLAAALWPAVKAREGLTQRNTEAEW